jgi:hypothetical protein
MNFVERCLKKPHLITSLVLPAAGMKVTVIAGARFRGKGEVTTMKGLIYRSADFQSAVSPASSRQNVRIARAPGDPRRLRIGNPRYSRLEVCATRGATGRAL